MSTPENNVNDLMQTEKGGVKKFLLRWEMILVYLLVAILAVLIIARGDILFGFGFINGNVQSMIQSGMDLSIMVMGMIFILMLGDIDVSAGSVMLISAMGMGMSFETFTSFGMPEIPASIICVLVGVLVGAMCGAINGTLVAVFKMPAVIVTIASSMVFRGLGEIVVGENSLKTFPSWFSALSWRNLFGVVPYSMIVFLVVALIFATVLHKTKFGRELYIIGNSATVARYSGIKVTKIKILVFIIMGIASALSGVIFAGYLGGVSPSMGTGYELRAIAIAVLGGVSTNGGKGKAWGPIIATFIMACLMYTLNLFNVHANVQKIITGVILIIAVMIPELQDAFRAKREELKRRKHA